MKILDFFSRNQTLIIFGCLLLAVLFLIDKPLGVGTLLILFLASVSLFFIGKYKDQKQRKILGILFLMVFSLHIVVVIFMYYTNFQPFSGGGGDYTLYHQYAQEISDRLHQGNFYLQGAILDNYYPVIIGYLYALTIPNMLIGQLFNAWLTALLSIFLYLMVREIGGAEKDGFWVGLVASVYPSMVFFGSLLLKDALVALLCIIGVFLTVKIVKSFSIARFIGFFVILTGLIHFRFYVGYALMFGFVISWFLASSINFKKRVIYGLVIVFILGFSPMMLGSGYYGFKNLNIYLSVEKITFYKEVVYAPSAPPVQPAPAKPVSITPASAKPVPGSPAPAQLVPKENPPKPKPTAAWLGRGSSIEQKAGLGNPITFIKDTLVSFIYAFIGPFPWQLQPGKYLFVLPEMIMWYFLLFFIATGVVYSIKKRNKLIFPLIIFSILVMGVLAVYMSNFGLIARLRMSVFLTLFCLFPLGFESLKSIKIPLLEKLFHE